MCVQLIRLSFHNRYTFTKDLSNKKGKEKLQGSCGLVYGNLKFYNLNYYALFQLVNYYSSYRPGFKADDGPIFYFGITVCKYIPENKAYYISIYY